MQHVEKVVKRDVKIIGKEFQMKASTLNIQDSSCKKLIQVNLSKDMLFSQPYDREDVVGSVLGVNTSISAVPGISVRSLHKVVSSVRQNVVLVHPDEVVPVGPHWC